MQPSTTDEDFLTLFDVLEDTSTVTDVSGPCVGDDRERSPYYEALGPSVGDDNQVLLISIAAPV
jgi:hypothetical protein